MANQILVFVLTLCVQFANGKEIDNKRLLLNDPDVSAARLLQMEKSIQKLTSTVQGLTHLVTTINGTLQTVNADLAAEKVRTAQTTHGSTYVRWGRSKCPSNAEIVYSGM
ncbi:Hypothetical predicted protein [Mytilus galloprovincialis]|uniref:Uncharacterized protein n=1 Tax=Mytilus galloprovincialis TaxID=29158 RepID=A0A8B6DSJ4_MYTGA|nr:Hypothetical predicted protein [Mytilus galloprovincialis]